MTSNQNILGNHEDDEPGIIAATTCGLLIMLIGGSLLAAGIYAVGWILINFIDALMILTIGGILLMIAYGIGMEVLGEDKDDPVQDDEVHLQEGDI